MTFRRQSVRIQAPRYIRFPFLPRFLLRFRSLKRFRFLRCFRFRNCRQRFPRLRRFPIRFYPRTAFCCFFSTLSCPAVSLSLVFFFLQAERLAATLRQVIIVRMIKIAFFIVFFLSFFIVNSLCQTRMMRTMV